MVVGLSTEFVCTATVLVRLAGWKSVTIAVTIALLTSPLTTAMSKRWTTLLIQNWGLGRDRNAVLQKAFLAIRHIKLSAAEESWKQRIYQIRQKELDGYSKIAWLLFWKGIVGNIIPAILSGIPIYIYSRQGHALTPAMAFTFINLFKQIHSKLWEIPQKFPQIQAGWASASELEAFLKKEEISEPQFISSDTLSMNNATIAWYNTAHGKQTFQLKHVNAAFPTGKLSIISGKTGCGKSLLLSALAGEAKMLSGAIGRPPPDTVESPKEGNIAETWIKPGTCALVSQNPWMDNATVRDNILFGLPMDKERYARVLYCCALDKDLLRLKDGDMTFISIKGVSLSGGQRCRVALARALYSRASYLLLDDVLSAVDAEIREWIVKMALCGSLAHNRTRVLATHHEKQVVAEAAYRLHIHDHTATGELLVNNTSSSIENGVEKSTSFEDGFDYALFGERSDLPGEEKAPATTTPTNNPEPTDRSFRLAPYVMYFNISGGGTSWLLALTSLVICEWSRLSTSSRFEEWVSEKETDGAANSHNLTPFQAYMLMSALTALAMAMRGVVMFKIYRIASQTLFCQMTNSIFGAPLQWLESTSQGEILQRYDRSMRNVDEDVTYAISGFLALVSQLITFLWFSASFSLYEIPLTLALFYLFFLVGRNVVLAKKHLTTIESAASSATLQHRSALYAPDGVSTARTYGMNDHFFQRANELFDRSASTTWYSILHGIVTDFQLGVLGAVYVSLSCYSIAISGAGASAAGTALSFAVQLSETVAGCVQHISAVDSGLMAAERLNEYGSIPQESCDGADARDSWPEEGLLQVCKYTAGYGPGLPDTLRDVTFTVKPGDRVGVVGRTGAGKSTLALSFARLLDQRGGSISIDSVDISRIKPEVLRKRILIIPQDPYLFGGRLRTVHDPDGGHSDEELVASLKRFRFFHTTAASVEAKASTGDADLSFTVSEGGTNLSQGQRQILCLAKAMLSQKKVVIMDEATSAVDMETDSTIQAAIRDGLQGATVMVIAHRLATVAHLDRVLVMDDGKVLEFGKPADLYRQGGLFFALVNHSVDKEDLVERFNMIE